MTKEKNSICNGDPGQEIKISHLSESTQEELKKIFTKYEGAFAKTPYDCGEYNGLVVSLDVLEGKTAYQKERVMRDSDKSMVKKIIDDSVQAGIFELSSVGTERYICNLNCVAKPDSQLREFSKADKAVNQSKGLRSNLNRICVD